VRDAWTRWGRLPAPLVTVAFFLLALGVALAFHGTASAVGGLILVAVLLTYCAARPAGGWDLFALIAFPNVVATVAHDAIGAPRWIGVVLIPPVVWVAWRMDRPGGATADAERSEVG
jgi:hypothetical protein